MIVVLVLSSLEATLCWARALLQDAVVIIALLPSLVEASLCWAMVLLQDAVVIVVLVLPSLGA